MLVSGVSAGCSLVNILSMFRKSSSSWISGLNGAGTILWYICSQLTPSKKMCRFISSTPFEPSLSRGYTYTQSLCQKRSMECLKGLERLTLRFRSPLSRPEASSEKSGRISISRSVIIYIFSNLFLFLSLNGLIPDSISYIIRPYKHQNTHSQLTVSHTSTPRNYHSDSKAKSCL